MSDKLLNLAYSKVDNELRIRYLKIACILALIIVPGGTLLDFIVYKPFFWTIFKIRMLNELLLVLIAILTFTCTGHRQIKALGMAWGLIINLSLCWMIFVTEGPDSPYYAGLNLTILGLAVLLPLTVLETSIVCIATLIMYFTVCLLYVQNPFLIISESMLINNMFL